jgi:hypothetical protein
MGCRKLGAKKWHCNVEVSIHVEITKCFFLTLVIIVTMCFIRLFVVII